MVSVTLENSLPENGMDTESLSIKTVTFARGSTGRAHPMDLSSAFTKAGLSSLEEMRVAFEVVRVSS